MLLMCFLLIKNTANEDHSYLMLRHFLYRLHAPINRRSNDEVCSKIGIWHNVTVKLGRPVTEVALTAKLCPFFGVHVHDLHSWMLSRLTTTTINIVLICNGPMQPHSAMSPRLPTRPGLHLPPPCPSEALDFRTHPACKYQALPICKSTVKPLYHNKNADLFDHITVNS